MIKLTDLPSPAFITIRANVPRVINLMDDLDTDASAIDRAIAALQTEVTAITTAAVNRFHGAEEPMTEEEMAADFEVISGASSFTVVETATKSVVMSAKNLMVEMSFGVVSASIEISTFDGALSEAAQ